MPVTPDPSQGALTSVTCCYPVFYGFLITSHICVRPSNFARGQTPLFFAARSNHSGLDGSGLRKIIIVIYEGLVPALHLGFFSLILPTATRDRYFLSHFLDESLKAQR